VNPRERTLTLRENRVKCSSSTTILYRVKNPRDPTDSNGCVFHFEIGGDKRISRHLSGRTSSALASFKMGMSRSVSLQSVRKSLYAAFALAVSPAIA